MNPRERKLLMIIGTVVGSIVLYHGVKYFFITPIAEAEEKKAKLEAETQRLEMVIQSRGRLVRRWMTLVGRTLSYDPSIVANRLDQDLKAIAGRHQLLAPSFSPSTGTKIGSKTGIEARASRVTAEVKFSKALAFLLEAYKTPYLCQVTKLSMAPILLKGRARDEVKLELTVETPIPPPIEKKQIAEAADAPALPMEIDPALGPARAAPRTPEDFPLLADRNVFRPYVAPPTNVIVVNNEDWKTAALRIAFMWDGKLSGAEIVETVASKSSKPFTGKGDVVEIKGAYGCDGKPFGPERIDFNAKKDFTYVIPVYCPAPPPVVVDLAVENQDKNPVDIDILVTNKDGQAKSKPTIRVKAGVRLDIDVFECKMLQVFATYGSGRKTQPATFSPQAGKQTYTVPSEPPEAVAVVEGPKPPVGDPAPDGSASVTGLVTYLGVQEMIAVTGTQRKIIRAGEPGLVDGGMLLAVHPLGGVVKMPSGNYYLYPLGKKFAERVKLDASEETELASAIDAWSRR